MSDKSVKPSKVLWVDLEMTGLDPTKDVILEVAAEITDFNFKTLASYEAMVKQKHDIVVERFQKNTWYNDFPENRDEFVAKLEDGKPSGEVEQELIDLIEEHFGRDPAILAGNSIWNDRMFIRQWWPALDLKLHYRMLDVSAFKILFQGKFGVDYEKTNSHRAFDDIQASIAEMQFYLDWFKSNSKAR